VNEGTITTVDGRSVGFADYGAPGDMPVVWCHGGPGSRWEPSLAADSATVRGIRLIGIDRPGYGRSTPQPGRTIGGWVPDALAVLDHLGVDRFGAIGMSTGGAYALALASRSSRVVGVAACGAVTDMQWAEGKAMNVCCHAMWNARDRDDALQIATVVFGARGENVLPPRGPVGLDAADIELFASPAFLSWWTTNVPEMFAHGVAGCVDDRLADAHGWRTFDVTNITCPVVVLHGSLDGLMPVANASHTARIVPGAQLRVVEGLGHLSLVPRIVEHVGDLFSKTAVTV
jgi:pimeloyl-ACP methyl ester carboxylesterase